MELITAIVGALAVLIGVYTVTTPARSRRISERLERLDRRESMDREAMLRAPLAERVGLPMMESIQGVGGRVLPSTVMTGIERRLQLAGEPISLHAYVGIQLGGIGLGILAILGFLAMGASGMFLIFSLVIAGISSVFPFLWLDSAGSSRQAQILRELPDAVDLVVTMVEAGISIEAALWKVANETTGPLADEFRLTMRETTVGRSRREALLDLLARTDVRELRQFIHAILHAQETGVPLGNVLRTQAAEIRLRKRQRAEHKAGQAPVKILLLMLFFVMPSLLIVMLGPAVIRMGDLL